MDYSLIKSQIIFIYLYLSSVSFIIAQEPELILPQGHSQKIIASCFSFNNERVATSSNDKSVKIWDIKSGKLIKNMTGFTGIPNSLSFCPDNKNLLIGFRESDNQGYDTTSTIKLIEINSNKLIFELKGHRQGIISSEFSKNGKYILTSSLDNKSILWNATTGDSIINLTNNVAFGAAHFSPDGNKISLFSKKNELQIWDISNKILLNLSKNTFGRIVSMHFSNNSKKVVFSTSDSTIYITDLYSFDRIKIKDKYLDNSTIVHFSIDDKYIVSSSNDNIPKLINSKTGLLVHDFFKDKRINDYFKNRNRIGAILCHFDNKSIITTNDDGMIYVWDIVSGKFSIGFIGHNEIIHDIKFSPNGKYLLTTATNICKIWDQENGLNNQILTGQVNTIQHAIFNTSGTKIIAASDNSIKIWDFKTGKLIQTLAENNGLVNFIKFSPDGLFLASSNKSGSIIIRNGETFDSLLSINTNNYISTFFPFAFSPNSKYILLYTTETSYRQKLNIYNIYSGILKYSIIVPDIYKVLTASFINDYQIFISTLDGGFLYELPEFKQIHEYGNPLYKCISSYSTTTENKEYLATVSFGGKQIILWDNNSRTPLHLLNDNGGKIRTVEFSKDNQYLIASNSSEADIWDIAQEKQIFKFKGHTSDVNFASFNPIENLVLTSSYDNTIKLWDAKNGKLKCTIVGISINDFVSQTDKGYYYGSKEGIKKLHYVTKDLKIITFEQLDIKYNRPDKVLQALGNSDTTLINSYKRAYDKRIEKLGVDTTAFFKDDYNVPDLEILNSSNINFSQKQKELKLQIRSKDGKAKLESFNLWVNEVPLFGQKGIKISWRNKMAFDTTVTINLAVGDNKIEASVRNGNGLESYRMPVNVRYEPDSKPKETVYFVGIGIEKFQNSSKNLQYCSADIKELAEKFKKKYGSQLVIDTLLNQNVTIQKVKDLKKRLKNSTENDKVILAYSGHGLLSKKLDYYLSTYKVNFESPEINGLAYEELENLLDGIPARKKILLIDACHSGEIDKINLTNTTNTNIKPIPNKPKKGGEIGDNLAPKLGLENSFDLMKDLFVNVGKYTGSIIISAAAGTQSAIESNHLKHGVFTHALLEAMDNNKTLKVSELKNIVGARVEQLTSGTQKPTLRNETVDVDWLLW